MVQVSTASGWWLGHLRELELVQPKVESPLGFSVRETIPLLQHTLLESPVQGRCETLDQTPIAAVVVCAYWSCGCGQTPPWRWAAASGIWLGLRPV